MLVPAKPAPQLSLPTTSGQQWSLHERQPGNFTLLIFYRGLHCPLCKKQLQEACSLLDEFDQRKVEVIAISMDTQARAVQSRDDWELGELSVAYGLSEDQAREWGLYISSAIKDGEPDQFSEPGIFLIRPDATLYYIATQSMPFARPPLKQLLTAIDFAVDKDYPARGQLTG
ncbi:MAG: peroxiredoxin-like family protein [Wenzhouxiangellaceae bacterium]